MKVLIAGATGMLGTDVTEVFKKALGESGVAAFGSSGLDVTNAESVRTVLDKVKPTIVVNCSAFTQVDKAETEKDKAFALNVMGPEYLAESSARLGARLIHFSTDQVFDGSGSKPWQETDKPNPLNVYGRTKLEGESRVLPHRGNVVLRVQWLYGHKKDRFSILKDKSAFTPFSDQFGAPTWTLPLSEMVLRLATEKVEGLFHYSYDDFASWFEVYQFVVKQAKFGTQLAPKKTSEVSLPAPRPLFSVLDNRRLLNTLGLSGMGGWREPLARFLSLMLQ